MTVREAYAKWCGPVARVFLYECQHGDVRAWRLDPTADPVPRFDAVCPRGDLNYDRCRYERLPDGVDAIPRGTILEEP